MKVENQRRILIQLFEALRRFKIFEPEDNLPITFLTLHANVL